MPACSKYFMNRPGIPNCKFVVNIRKSIDCWSPWKGMKIIWKFFLRERIHLPPTGDDVKFVRKADGVRMTA